MATARKKVARGSDLGRRLQRTLGEELRTARLMAGISQERLGEAVGLSGAHIGRLERGSVPGATLLRLAQVFAVLGMRLAARVYPEGPPLRDAGHARLLARFRGHLAPPLRFRTEVPVRLLGDLRAWDGEVALDGEVFKVEAETNIHDLQAIDRRIGLKMADDDADRVILLVADTVHNREVLRAFGCLLDERFPLRTRQVLRDLRAGKLPDRSGIVIL